jgi:hypothetical protein
VDQFKMARHPVSLDNIVNELLVWGVSALMNGRFVGEEATVEKTCGTVPYAARTRARRVPTFL